MAQVLFLELPGRWRTPTVCGLLLLAAMPGAPLVYQAIRPDAPALGDAFWSSAGRSAALAFGGSALAAVVGLPLGTTAALYGFPGRRLFVTLSALPLVVPSFLWAIGWSALAVRLPTSLGAALGGPSGCLLVSATSSVPLVMFAAFAAAHELSRSQVHAARIGGGDGRVLRVAIEHGVLPALFAAALGGVLTLADPGPGQIFGVHTAASEVLTSFAARYDLALAARQCLALTALAIAAAVPLAVFGWKRLPHAVLARQSTQTAAGHRCGGGVVAFAAFAVLAVGLPVLGLVLPLVSEPAPLDGRVADVWRQDHGILVILGALSTAGRTAADTLVYAGGAAAVATALGVALAFAVGRSAMLRALALGVAVALFSCPPAASALGTVSTATTAPEWLDPLVRSRLTVCVVLGLRLFPVSAVFAIRAWGAIAPSWVRAAALHGVRLPTYLRHIVWPTLQPSVVSSFVLVSLLASADVGSVLLLHPPGEASLPLAIFTVMANAPERTVAALCLVYIVAASVAVSAALHFARREA